MPRFMDFHEDLKLPAEAIAWRSGWRSWPPPSCARPRAGPGIWVRRR